MSILDRDRMNQISPWLEVGVGSTNVENTFLGVAGIVAALAGPVGTASPLSHSQRLQTEI